MEKEWNELVGIFQKYVELHKHLKTFQEVPQQFVDDVKKVNNFWKFQSKFIEKELPEELLQKLIEIRKVVSNMRMDYCLAKIL